MIYRENTGVVLQALLGTTTSLPRALEIDFYVSSVLSDLVPKSGRETDLIRFGDITKINRPQGGGSLLDGHSRLNQGTVWFIEPPSSFGLCVGALITSKLGLWYAYPSSKDYSP